MPEYRVRRADALSILSVLALVAVPLALVALLAGHGRAWADPPEGCSVYDEESQICLEWEVPGTPGATPTGNHPGGGERKCRDENGTEVPCTKDDLVWMGAPRYCYGGPVDPQPPADDPVWAVNNITPADGQFWTCMLSASGGTASYAVWFVRNGQEPVDPRVIAVQLRATAPFETANAKIAPPPSYHTYINYLNWLWIPANQWHQVSVSLTAQGATVRLSATPAYVSWDMGNGESVSCAGAGREWVKGMPEDAPTNCSFRYSTMKDPKGDTWSISARVNYTLRWTCAGNCGGQTSGDLGEVTAPAGAPTSITVLQRQTVVTH
jgi:hypothetical protein